MTADLLPLFVALPLLSTGLLCLVRNPTLQRVILLAVPTATAVGGISLLIEHVDTPAIAHHVGAYIPGVAIVFVSDSFSSIMLSATGVLSALSAAYLIGTGEDRYRFVPPLVTLLITGVNGALLTGDLFNLFVFVEVMLLPSYALIAVTGTWRRFGIGRMFVLVNLVTSTILVTGVGLTYGATGTVNLASLAGVAERNPQASLAVSVVLFALLVKAGAVPVHGWLPRSYPATSAGMMSLFSGVHTKIGLYAVFRIYSVVYGPQAAWVNLLTVIVVVTILVGSISTFGERRIRGALAFQMIAGVGQILIGLVVFSQFSIAAGVLYMVHHMITMGSLIMASGNIESTYGSGRFDRLQGLLRREPLTAGVMALGMASLVGLPPTSGLWAKVNLVGGAADAEPATAGWLIGSVALASVVSLLALQRLWTEVFWGSPMKKFLPDDPVTSRGEATELSDDIKIQNAQAWPAAFLIVLSLGLFVGMGVVWPFFDRAAMDLVDLSDYVKAVLG